MDVALSIGGIYLFILLGFSAKRYFAERLHESTLVLLSIYFLQPMLVFWGLTRRPIDRGAVEVPLLFVGFILLFLLLALPLAGRFFTDPKERSIAIVSSIIGNTGNLGIPLGIALFGEASVLYTSIINLANVFLVYTLGVYFYSRGSFSVRESLLNILKLPAIWFGLGAIAFNLSGASLPRSLELPLTMGAYSTMVLQLMIFGIYLATVKLRRLRKELAFFVTGAKFVVIPLLAWGLLPLVGLDPLLFNVLLLELIVPMAVMNVNLAALYDCRPDQVAFLTFLTSLLFLGYLFVMVRWGFR
ncbi:AEC family transporter [Nitratifractor sp.]|uniref:AEC family transporter n=1 Tax=Nitratifractor sp. TaxID=2268144 RepID=UPI0025E8A468|nr:AEC family transporter [Nitratifractor sp.]